MDTEKIIEIGLSKMNQILDPSIKCHHFCKLIYEEAGLKLIYAEQPYVNLEDLYKGEYVGNILFLKHKNYGPEKRYSHIGIIFPNNHLLHYSKNFNKERRQEVLLTPFEILFTKYNIAHIVQRVKANSS